MGASYANISVWGAGQRRIADWISSANIAAVVGPDEGEWCVFSDVFTDMMDYKFLREILTASSKSGRLAVGISVYDEDVFRLWLAADGEMRSTYISCPGMEPGMETDDPDIDDMRPVLTGSDAWLELFPAIGSEQKILDVFRIESNEDYIDPIELHEEIVTLLQLPRYSLDFGYSYVTEANYGFEDSEKILKNTKIIEGRRSYF